MEEDIIYKKVEDMSFIVMHAITLMNEMCNYEEDDFINT